MITSEYLASFRNDARGIVKTLYKDEKGEPIILTDGQCDIFNLIFKKLWHRVHLETFTRYGKSLTVALGVLTRICTYPEKFAIAAGNEDQAKIITSHLIQHIFDNDFTKSRFVIGKNETEEQIRRYRNKSHLNFKLEGGLLGEVFVTNAAGAMGFGAPNVIEDESSLILDDEEALVFRMLGDSTENFLCKIGNSWASGHFDASRDDLNYFKIKIDYYQGIKEGRITPELVEEARRKPFFGELYECKRPPLAQQDAEGWIPLLTKDEIERAFVSDWQGFGVNKLGGDVAGGGKNFSVIVQRTTNAARLLLKNQEADTMAYVERVLTHQIALKVPQQNVAVDKVGIGRGVCDILARQWGYWDGVNAGDKLAEGSQDEQIYFNLRAKMFWKLQEWVLYGGKFLITSEQDKTDWLQLKDIKYRQKLEGMRGKIQIMPKEKMLMEGIQSPDVADALSLTFAKDDEKITEQGLENMFKSAEIKSNTVY